MKIHISEGNSKLGKIPNISLPPVVTCREKVPCAAQCYAKKAFRLWPSVARAWEGNWNLYQRNSGQYFNEIEAWLWTHHPTHFRWHVSGDIPDEDYLVRVLALAAFFPQTQFMLFTKRWCWLPQPDDVPENLSIILSMWPGLKNPKELEFPRAWLSHDKRKPEHYFKCPGKCDQCYKCWEIVGLGYDVVFDLH